MKKYLARKGAISPTYWTSNIAQHETLLLRSKQSCIQTEQCKAATMLQSLIYFSYTQVMWRYIFTWECVWCKCNGRVAPVSDSIDFFFVVKKLAIWGIWAGGKCAHLKLGEWVGTQPTKEMLHYISLSDSRSIIRNVIIFFDWNCVW